jgi:opacity protein-like surface antigen
MAHTGQRFRGLMVCACAAVVMAWPAAAISDPNPSSSSDEAPSAPADFMFARPRVTFGVRGNWIFASAGSDIHDLVTDTLTIERSSFDTPAFGGEVSFNINPRFDVSLGLEYSKQSLDSEYRDQVEQLPNGTTIPIAQTTSLQHSNLYVSARFALLPRGRRISRFAWIPRSFVPYVGAGAGINSYSFQQDGDFVDFVDDRIFTDVFRSNGRTPSFHVFGGADIQVYKRMFMSLEGRYMWAEAPLSRDFIDFEPIDLGGFRFGAGLHVVF